MNNERPMHRITQAVDWPSVGTEMLRDAAITRKPGDNIGPKDPTTAADNPTMRRMPSFFHSGHYDISVLWIEDDLA